MTQYQHRNLEIDVAANLGGRKWSLFSSLVLWTISKEWPHLGNILALEIGGWGGRSYPARGRIYPSTLAGPTCRNIAQFAWISIDLDTSTLPFGESKYRNRLRVTYSRRWPRNQDARFRGPRAVTLWALAFERTGDTPEDVEALLAITGRYMLVCNSVCLPLHNLLVYGLTKKVVPRACPELHTTVSDHKVNRNFAEHR